MSKQYVCRYPGCDKTYDYNPEPFDDMLRNSRRYCAQHLHIIEFHKYAEASSVTGCTPAYSRKYYRQHKKNWVSPGYKYQKPYKQKYNSKNKNKIRKYMRDYMRRRRARLRRARQVLCK
ncbi:MAG: hypothetical protein PHY56_00090 [Candidatus Omnitrophica bacterium]|nr:hypothetical protein [Candidatus Omnitrophota bacterium]